MGFISRALGSNQVVMLASGKKSPAVPMSINYAAQDKQRIPRSVLEEDYKYDPLTFNIINKNLQLMTHAGFKIKTKTARAQKFYDEFFAGIGDVGEQVTDKELVEYILQDLLMYGNSYVELIYNKANVDDKVLDLRVIPEKYMDYAKNSSGDIALDKTGKPLGYVMELGYGSSKKGRGDEVPKEYKNIISVEGTQIFFLPQRIAHFKLFTYGDRFYGLGLIESSHSSTFRKLKIEDARTNEIYTRGANTIIATVGDNEHEPSPQDLKQVLDNISNFKHDRYFSFPKWVKIDTLSTDDNQSVDRTLDYLRINQASTAGMPMAIITGQGETANKQTLDTQQFILELSLQCIVNKFASSFKKFILKPIAESNHVQEMADIIFGDIVAEDKTSKNDRLTSAVRNGILAPEEVRPYLLGAEGLEEDKKAYTQFRETEKAKPKKLPSAPFPEAGAEDPTGEAEAPGKPKTELMAIPHESSKKAVELGGFHMPDIRRSVDYATISEYMVVRRHQVLHILWDKLKDGFTLGWTFEELYREHKRTVNRLKVLKLAHLQPINGLDTIKVSYD